jgi:hypothetical protein
MNKQNKDEVLTTIHAAIRDMESKISRDSKHIYRLNETGEALQGVSTVSSIVPKEWLAAWGAKEAVKALGFDDYNDFTIAHEMWKKIIACTTVEEYVAILKGAKGASARKSKQAMVDGKKGHTWLENFVLASINPTMPMPELPVGTPLERPLKQFLDWQAGEVNYWIASEALVCNVEHRYAGQLDAIYMSKTGQLCLADFKFASHISEDYYLQTSGYAACFEPYNISFDNRVIIRLPKTLESDFWNPKEFKYQKVPNTIEVAFVPTTYEGDKQAFFSALPLKAWINYVEAFNKK